VAFYTDGQLLTELAAALKASGGSGDLQPYYTSLVAAANAEAKARLRQFVVGRGYTPASVETWELAAPYQRRYVIYRVGIESRANFSEAEAAALKAENPFDELAALGDLFDAAGVELPKPGNAVVSRAGAGVPAWRRALDHQTAAAYRAGGLYPPPATLPAGWGSDR
jgi:hypothetical protein